MITDRLLRRLDGPATCASFARFLRVDSLKADPIYIYWLLQHVYSIGEMWEHQVQHTGVARFQYTRFAETIDLPLPSRAQQELVAGTLTALDDKIELNRRIWDTRLKLALTVHHAMRRDATEVVALGDLFEVGLSGVWGEGEPGGESVVEARVARGRDLEALVGGGIPDVPVRYITERQAAKRMPGAGEIWTAGSGSLGPTLLITDGLIRLFDRSLTYSNFVKRLLPRRDVLDAPVAWLALLDAWRSGAFLEFSSGTAIPNLDAKALLTLEVPLLLSSSKSTLKDLVGSALDPGLLRESRTLAALRDALLPKLISGELRIRDADRAGEQAR